MTRSVKTTCPYCGVGCGVIATLTDQNTVQVAGDPEHPANFGRLCSKGAALAETLSLDDRLLRPEIENSPVDWNTALDYVAKRFVDIIRQHGPDSVAFYVSGQLLTEDYYVANKLMKGFIGSANIDTNSRLCMASSVAGHKRAFGSDTVPCSYEDLERAKLIVLVGSNTAWCHPVLFQRISQAKQDNPDLQIVVIDPRRTATCDIADLHLAIKPGSDTALFNGLLCYLADQDERNDAYVSQHTEGMEAALAQARQQLSNLDVVSQYCDVPVKQLEQFYRLFARTERVITAYSQGVNQWSFGTDKVNSIINCHLLTGRIGRPGMGPFSFTGQPNAMGGREVGGLANQLAAHIDIENESLRKEVQAFWKAPLIAEHAGHKAVQMFKAIESGQIKAVWIMATNPAVSMPDADRVRAALARCDFVVVSDCVYQTDTLSYADVKLPALAWGEKDGTVTNSERRISRQRAFLPPPEAAKPDWWIISEIGKRMGYTEQFNYRDAAAIFREHAGLSGIARHIRRDFDISGWANISDAEYEQLPPTQWPVTALMPQGTKRMFGDGNYFTSNGKAKFVPVAIKMPATLTNKSFPLVLNTGRVRDQWHTMTRTGKSARLSSHIYEPIAMLHPDDAENYAIHDGELVELQSSWGHALARSVVTDEQRQGEVFMPMHWNDQFTRHGYADAMVNPHYDPISGQPEFKHTPITIKTFAAKWHGFLLSRRQLPMKALDYWSTSRGDGFWRYQLAGMAMPINWEIWARELLCCHADNVNWIEFYDKGTKRYRAARLNGDRLESCLFVSTTQVVPDRGWLEGLFAKATLTNQDRAAILTGKPGKSTSEPGRTICACYQVGVNQICTAIEKQGCNDVAKIGKLLKAGTNCGSCLPEIRKLLANSPSNTPLISTA